MARSARKNAELAKPSASGESARSRISSGAITLRDERKNCDKTVVADSMARSVAAIRRRGDRVTGGSAWAGQDKKAGSARHLPPRAALGKSMSPDPLRLGFGTATIDLRPPAGCTYPADKRKP